MTEQPSPNTSQLSDLQIRGFRGVGELTIPRLGRVTLFAGRNGVGKTTVLDAVRLYAARGHRYALDPAHRAPRGPGQTAARRGRRSGTARFQYPVPQKEP